MDIFQYDADDIVKAAILYPSIQWVTASVNGLHVIAYHTA